jgi:hypothetical protein
LAGDGKGQHGDRRGNGERGEKRVYYLIMYCGAMSCGLDMGKRVQGVGWCRYGDEAGAVL